MTMHSDARRYNIDIVPMRIDTISIVRRVQHTDNQEKHTVHCIATQREVRNKRKDHTVIRGVKQGLSTLESNDHRGKALEQPTVQ